MDLEKLRDKRTLERVVENLMKSNERPMVGYIGKIDAEEYSEQEGVFQHYLSTIPKTPREKAAFRFMWMIKKGYNAMNAQEFACAIVLLRDALQMLMSGDAKYFSSEFYNADYIILFDPTESSSWSLHLDMVMCCIGLAQLHMEIGYFPEAFEWLTEIEVLYGCVELCFAKDSDILKTLQYYESHMRTRMLVSRMFMYFGNSGTAAYHAERCRIYRTPNYITRFPEIIKINTKSRSEACLFARHPDLHLADEWDVQFPSLQIRGIWNKLSLHSKFRPPGRSAIPMWIWRSRLYKFGGKPVKEGKSGSNLKILYDLWYLDLRQMDNWRRLPDLPAKYYHLGVYASSAIVYNDYAWLFNGLREILRFNMISDSWDSVTTEMSSREKHKWPYGDGNLLEPSVASLNHFMYVFGGDLQGKRTEVPDSPIMGSDIFMVLNMKSLRWRCLGDPSLFKRLDYPGKYWPLPRFGAACWTVPNENRFYLMYGAYDYRKKMHNPKFIRGAGPDHDPYHMDLWSYSIDNQTWTRERLSGNYPCPRENMAIVHQPKHNAVMLFGGRNMYMRSYSSSPSPSLNEEHLANNELYPDLDFTYFADTFVMYMAERRWRQVITRSFPCYMGEASFLADELTGENYLYGGFGPREYNNKEESEKLTPCCYTDLYRLDIEQQNSAFRMDVFLAGSLNYLKFGNQRRCFTCKKIGSGFFKCQGSCGGRYVYCSVQCQRAGWKEHKYIHGCRKIC